MTANQIHVVTRIFIVAHSRKLIEIVILIADQNTQTNSNSNTNSFSKLEN